MPTLSSKPKLRLGRYNTWVETPAGHAVFNGRSGTLVRLAAHQRANVEQFLAGETHFDEDVAPLIAQLIKLSLIHI